MRNVLQKAQELAEAILQSDVYQRSKAAEEAMTADPEAARCLADYLEKQRAVNAILSTEDMDATALAEAGAALQEAEDRLHYTETIVKEKKIFITDTYESYLGKEFLVPEKLDELKKIMENGTAVNLSEAIEEYRSRGKK